MAAKNSTVDLDQFKLDTEFARTYVIHKTGRSHLWGAEGTEKWEGVTELGQGRGSVCLQTKENTSELRVVKRLDKESLRREGFEIDFSRELRTLVIERERSDLFVQLLGWYEDKAHGYAFFAMEYLEHGNLGRYLMFKGSLEETAAAQIVQQILEGLAFLHVRDISHGKLNIENVLIASTFPIRVKISAFGHLSPMIDTLLSSRQEVAAYIAPEILGMVQVHISPDYTYPADMWALGCILYNILTLDTPFLNTRTPVGPLLSMVPGIFSSPLMSMINVNLLYKFCNGIVELPISSLQEANVSDSAQLFIRSLLVANPRDRISAVQALDHEWILGALGAGSKFPPGNKDKAITIEKDRRTPQEDAQSKPTNPQIDYTVVEGTFKALEKAKPEYRQRLTEVIGSSGVSGDQICGSALEGCKFESGGPGLLCSSLTSEKGLELTGSTGVELASMGEEAASSAERATGPGDAIEGEVQEENLPLDIVAEPRGLFDHLVTPPTLTANGRYSWPEMFANGKTDINFEIAHRWSLFNWAKGWVEDSLVREPINWWPLSPRRHSLSEGYIWVNWKCRCGKRLSSVISKERRNQYNQWVSAPGNTPPPSNTQTIPARITPQKTSLSVNTRASLAPGNPPPLSSANNPRGIAVVNQPVVGGGKSAYDKRLILCINLGARYTVISYLNVLQCDNDVTIFHKLKKEYRRVRSWRMLFSLYSISEIRFVKFRPFFNKYASCNREPALPTPTDPGFHYYEYLPQPIEEIPPIPPQQLMMCFEKPSCANGSDVAILAFPKRLNGQIGRGERYGWGLHACENLSFCRTAILSIIILVGPFIFFIYWLLRHPGDLQNASIPIFIGFSIIATFIVLPHYFP